MPAQDTPSRHLDKIVVRVPDGMRDALKDRAARSGRSLNTEIVMILGAALNSDTTPQEAPMPSANEENGQIVIRPPEGMREKIKAAADANARSMNAEIVLALQAHLDGRGGATADLRMTLAGQAMSGFLAQPDSVNLWTASFVGDPDARELARNCLALADMLIEEAGKP